MDIRDLPRNDIYHFLEKNNVKYNNIDIYDKTMNLIRMGSKYYPISIIQWIKAHNLISYGVMVPVYSIEDIRNMKQDKLLILSDKLRLKIVNIDNIVGILKYMHRLSKSYLDSLPSELVENIALNNYGVKEINYLCNSSSKLNKILCDNDRFWREKYLRTYGEPGNISDILPTDWKKEFNKKYNFFTKLSVGSKGVLQLGGKRNIDGNPVQIAMGAAHVLILDSDNNIWVAGSNMYGQLGIESEEIKIVKNPIMIPNLKAKFISCGDFHSIIIDLDDIAWSFGANYYGQCGLPTAGKIVRSATKIKRIKIKFASCGNNHSMMIDFNNNIWVFGSDSNSQLGFGFGGSTIIPVPKKLDGIMGKFISCGKNKSFIIDTNNIVNGCGLNNVGELGPSTTFNGFPGNSTLSVVGDGMVKFVKAYDNVTFLIDMNDRLWYIGSFGNYQSTTLPIMIHRGPVRDVIAVSESSENEIVLIVDNDDKLKIIHNSNKKLLDDITITNVEVTALPLRNAMNGVQMICHNPKI